MSRIAGRIVMGAQIRAARSLLGWSQDELARAADLNANAVAYWEQTVAIPTGRHEPHACRKIARALSCAGVEFIGHAKPGVRLVENPNYCSNPPSRARARHGLKLILSGLAVRRCKTVLESHTKLRVLCGAKTRAGAFCQRQSLANGRCRNHGGMSTGPRTAEGRRRISVVQHERWAQWRAQREQ